MINFGIRQSFEKIEQIKERFSNLNVPVELALPYYWDIYRLNLGISRDMICTVFRQLQKEKKILCLDKGQSAKSPSLRAKRSNLNTMSQEQIGEN